ncbi:hypothetical protein [Colwellia sp. E2M01]|uniref:hypothetical protein n=1 Tax=Colwellia sp. E2M01 TaxID=2841561 RepID=UPI001C08499E|nr:hypothetical protein [Colwellia sp. E2M01]MBU2870496.1 hypothetical protein [Colwellia sp. E2M01]
MDKLTVQFTQLIAQRKVLSFNFCCYKESFVDNTQKLVTLAHLIHAQNNNQCILSAQNSTQITDHLQAKYQSKDQYNEHELALVVALKLIIQPQLQSELLTIMLTSEQAYLPSLSLTVAKLLGNNLIFTIDFINEFTLPISDVSTDKANEKYQQQVFIQKALFTLYYSKKLMTYLSAALPEYKNYDSRIVFAESLSAINWLTIDVLSDNKSDVHRITTEFIQQEYLNSYLFDVFITSLNEHEVTQVVNLLSVDNAFIPYIIHAMALSGYIKFIPFLAQYLQQAPFVSAAHQALRIILGSKLDKLIPLTIQFNNDIEQRQKDLQYYGAKILNAWQQGMPSIGFTFEQQDNKRLLNGIELSIQTAEHVAISGSQWHRYVATLYQQQAGATVYCYNAHALEVN